MRKFPAIILNEPYADWVKTGKKKIETRMRMFKHCGDIVICCDKGKSAASKNAGKALCIVNIWDARPMKDSDVEAACIGNAPGRVAYLLKDWRHFSYDFKVSDYAVTKNWQGIFTISIPEDCSIIPMPEILPFEEKQNSLFNL